MKLEEILKTIEENQSKISAYGKFDAAVLKKINYKLRLDWNYYSNRMEGGTLTREETRSVMVGNIDIQGKPFKDIAEMNGHNNIVLEVLKMSKGEIRISEKRIKDIHKAIMHEEDSEKAKEIGKWKSKPNEIINYKDEKISFTHPSDVADEIHKLLDRTNAQLDWFFGNKPDKNPLEIASQFHIDYVSIHPFYDGNGRTSRILTNILLMACGYPAIIIKDEHKKAYYQILADIQAYGGKADLFYEFIGERILDTQRLILDALAGKDIEEKDDLDKKLSLLKSELANGDVDDDVQTPFNKDTFLKIYDTWLSQLIEGLVKTITKFDDLFAKPVHYVSIKTNEHSGVGGQTVTVNFKDKTEAEIISQLRAELTDKNKHITNDVTVTIHAWYGTFKKGAIKNAFGCNYAVEVFFDYLKFEVFRNTYKENVSQYPIISDELIEYVKTNPDVSHIFYDATGTPYASVEERNGKLYGINEKGEKHAIQYSHESKDILDGKYKHGGLERFIEPRLLHKTMTENEIEKLCREFGHTIFSHIDFHTKKIGLRK